MKRGLLILLALLALALPAWGQRFPKCNSCARDAHGRISRSVKAKQEFMRSVPCPIATSRFTPSGRKGRGCSGYQVDHIIPLACGGRDVPENMQWLTVAQHRSKTRRDATCSR